MLLRITLFLNLLLFGSSVLASPKIEFIESRKNLFKSDSLKLITPIEVQELLDSKLKLKKFLKQFGVLKLNVFNDGNSYDCQCENDDLLTGPTIEQNIFVGFESVKPLSYSIFDKIEIPKSIGPEFILLDNRHGEYIKFGLWSKNLRKWNIFTLNLHTYKTDSVSTELSVDDTKAKAEIKYQFKVGDSDMIEFNIYNQLNHDVLAPTIMKSGGQVKYRIKMGRKYYFDLFIFGSHELGM